MPNLPVIHLDRIGGGGTGTGWDGQVEFRGDLPITLINPPIGSVYLVEKPTKFLGITTYQSGLYMKDSDTGSLSDWRRLNIAVTLYNSDGSLGADRTVFGTTNRYSLTYDELGGYIVNVKAPGATGDVVSMSVGLTGVNIDRTGLAAGSALKIDVSTNEPSLVFTQDNGGVSPFTSTLKINTLTANRIQKLQDKDGNIALVDDDGTLILEGGLIFGTSKSATIVANTDDLNIADIEKTVLLRLDSTGNFNLTGLVPGSTTASQMLVVNNVGTNNITLKNNDAGSAASNRFMFGADVNLQSEEGITLVYDTVDLRWRSAGKNI